MLYILHKYIPHIIKKKTGLILPIYINDHFTKTKPHQFVCFFFIQNYNRESYGRNKINIIHPVKSQLLIGRFSVPPAIAIRNAESTGMSTGDNQ